MSVSGAVILVLSLAVLCGRVQCAEKVQLGFYSESLCPDCIAFANGPLDEAMNKARVSGSNPELPINYVIGARPSSRV